MNVLLAAANALDGRTHACAQCGDAFRSARVLQQHMETHSDVFAHKCARCGRAFRRKSTLQAHARTHERFACDICDTAFERRIDLLRHKRDVHDVHDFFECAHCPSTFSAPRWLREHYYAKHSFRESPFQCGTCGTSFSSQRGMRRHMHRAHKK